MGMRAESHVDKAMAVPEFLTQLKAIKRWGKAEEDNLSYISQPTLIVNGNKDMMVPTENSYDMHDKIYNSKLIIYPNAGHGSIFQYANQFAEEANRFLEE